MSLKICLNSEIHRVPKLPASFKALKETVESLFKASLPPNYYLQYIDNEGDKITLSNEDDYKSMLETDIATSTKSIKINIVSDLDNSFAARSDTSFQNQGSKTLDYEDKSQASQKTSNNQGQSLSKDELREMVTNIIYESLPSLAIMMKDLLNEQSNNSSQAFKPNPSTSTSTSKTNTSSQKVHQGVACDGCGVKPIVGVRYKCTACDNFDFCEKCEASVDHPHAFLKIKDPNTRIEDTFIDLGEIPVGPETGGPGHQFPRFGPFGGFGHGFRGRHGHRGHHGQHGHHGHNHEGHRRPTPFGEMLANYYKNLPEETRNQMNQAMGGLPETLLARFEQKYGDKKEEKKEESNSENIETSKDNKTKEYPEKVKQAAEIVKEIQPEVDIDKLMEFIAENPEIPVEELVHNYLQN